MGPDAAKAYVDKVVTEHPVVVFSKSYCRDWPAVKQILDSYNLQPPYQPYVVNLNYMDNMFSIQNYLEKTTGARTVSFRLMSRNHGISKIGWERRSWPEYLF